MSAGTGIQMVRYPVAELRRFCEQLLQAFGASEDEARVVADGLITAELRTHPGQGQGLRHLPRYAGRLERREFTPGIPPVVVSETPAMARIDGRNGFGHVISVRAMDLALEKAAALGVGLVSVFNGNHLGMASYTPLRAAAAGYIGICLTNGGPELAPWGGITPILGTNPWGIAVPSKGPFPLVLDIALTTAGKGMMRWHRREGLPIPPDWALTPDGRVSTDPNEAMDGPLLPIGGYKGSGLSFMTDILTGVLAGAAFGTMNYQDPTHHDVGYLMIALDPDRFVGRAAFLERVEAFVAQVHSSQLRPGFDEVLVPGELEYRRETERRANGIPIDTAIIEEIQPLVERYGVLFPDPVPEQG